MLRNMMKPFEKYSSVWSEASYDFFRVFRLWSSFFL